VGQVHTVQAEDPVRSRWCPGPLALSLGLIGAFLAVLAVLAVSALFAHPAGAATPPVSSPSVGTSAIGLVSDTAQSATTLVANVVAPSGAAAASYGSTSTTGAGHAPRPVATLLHVPAPALQGLAPAVQPITTAIASPLGPIVTTLTSVPTSITGIVAPVLQLATPFGVAPGTDATTIHPVLEADGPSGSSPAIGVRLRSPSPLPAPARPFQGFPLITTSSPGADSSSSSGGGALAAAPTSGPLLPDPLVTGVIPEQSGVPQLLFDLRSSPPG
jgi:hypothetical protein